MDSGDQIVLEGKRKQNKKVMNVKERIKLQSFISVTHYTSPEQMSVTVDQSSGSFTGFLSAFTHHMPIHVKWKQGARGLVKKTNKKKKLQNDQHSGKR